MKKIYMILAAMTLLSLSLNAQIDATKKVDQTQQTAPTGKKVDMQLGVAKMALNPTVHRAPARATETTTVTFTAGTDVASAKTITKDGVTITNTQTQTNNNSFSYNPYRLYAGTVTFTTTTGNITRIVINGTTTTYPVSRLSGTGFSVSNNVGTWNGSASSVTLTASGQARASSIVVTVETETGGDNPSVTTESVTVHENATENSSYLPVWGYNYDVYPQYNQMLYTAEQLGNLRAGTKIISLTFYPTTTQLFSGGNVTVSLGTTTQNSYSAFEDIVPDDLIEVASITPANQNYSTTGWTINFSTPFIYNGGNLLVQIETETGTWKSTSFYGTNQSANMGFYTYYNSSGSSGAGWYGALQTFQPKATFTYEGFTGPIHDLSIALSAPATAGAGTTVDVTATVTNNGDFAENGYTVTVSDGTNIVNITAQEELGIGETATFTVQFATSANAAGSTVNYTATVACTDDAVAANNSATASTSLLNLPPPINVAATAGNNHNATMTWEPPVDPLPVTESFENDGDGYNWTWSNTLSANTGTGLVYSESYHNNESGSGGVALYPDNWLISPEAILNGTFSLYAKGQDANYPAEVFGVYVCVGDYNPNDLSNFQQVGSDITTTSSMTQYTYDLSSFNGQIGHIAIVHHEVTDQFVLDIDDITFLAPPQPVSYNIYLDGVLVGNVPSSTNPLSYDFSNLADGNHTCAVSAVYDLGESVAVPATFTITSLPTPNAPTVTPTTGDANVTISITPDPVTDGNLVYYVEYNGQQTQDLTFPRGETDYVVTVHAYTTATSNYNESPEAVIPVTIPALPQTPAPTIAISSTTDNEVTITATGNGTVILNIPGYPQATGNGSASITVPRHMSDYVVTATATAQASGELVSTTTTQNITVPGMSNDGWTQMTGTYDNPNDLLSFLTLDANADTTMVMLLDQFLESTVFNDHPSSYTYVLKETKVINGVDSTMTSNPATIPVYKTNSTMRSLYTEAQVLADDYADEANRLTANAVNGEMDYDVVPDNNVLYYSLYRGGIQEQTPVVDVDHRISQLQKFEDKVGDNVTYYLTENHPTGILPRYDHEDNIGSQIVERLDVDYVTGVTGDQMSYVPVIWTFGLYTARGDGKNNSYGSDIKVNELGGVDVSSDIIVNWSDNNKMKVNGVDYYVVSPVITLDAVAPELVKANDNESYKYEPYMYRVWCTYTDAHNFGHVINPDGINYSLIETGLIEAPFLIGEVQADTLSDPSHVVIGRDLGHVSPQTQWSFAVTKEAVTNGDIKFVVRYYYKKVVTEPASPDQPAGMRGNRDGGADYAIYEKSTSSSNIVTGVNELWNTGKVVISQTYVNALGMQSDKPFDGLNIVVTRFSDGTTTTTKVVR